MYLFDFSFIMYVNVTFYAVDKWNLYTPEFQTFTFQELQDLLLNNNGLMPPDLILWLCGNVKLFETRTTHNCKHQQFKCKKKKKKKLSVIDCLSLARFKSWQLPDSFKSFFEMMLCFKE